MTFKNIAKVIVFIVLVCVLSVALRLYLKKKMQIGVQQGDEVTIFTETDESKYEKITALLTKHDIDFSTRDYTAHEINVDEADAQKARRLLREARYISFGAVEMAGIISILAILSFIVYYFISTKKR